MHLNIHSYTAGRTAIRERRSIGMDMKELWEGTCRLLKEELNSVSYQTWISGNLTPVRLENDTLTLCLAM